MSIQATAWAINVKTGSPAAKAVLMMIADKMAYHEDEAEGYLCGYPGQEAIADEAEMSVRSARDHIKDLVRKGFIQRKKRYRWDGVRTSDWYRIPVDKVGKVYEFDRVDDPEALKEWPELPAEDTQETTPNLDKELPATLPAEFAGSDPEPVDNFRLPANERSDYRQTVAGDPLVDPLVFKTPPTPPTTTGDGPTPEPEIKSGENLGEIQKTGEPPKPKPGNDKELRDPDVISSAADTFLSGLEKGPNPPSQYMTALFKAQIVRLMAQGASVSWIRSRVIESESMVGAKHFYGVWTKRAAALDHVPAVPAAVRDADAPMKPWIAQEGQANPEHKQRASQAIRDRLKASAAKTKALQEGKRPQLIGAR